MKRRDFAAGLLTAFVARPARAQTPAKQRRIAIVHPVIPAASLTGKAGTFYRRFFAELQRLGHNEGSTLIVERYSAEGHPDRYADLARSVMASKPDLIFAIGNDLAALFGSTTATTPIVAALIDPIRSGTVDSLAHPGGTLTGITVDAGFEIYGKRLQILKELLPTASRVGFVGVIEEHDSPRRFGLSEAAHRLGVALIDVSPPDVDEAEIRRTFAALPSQQLDAVLVGSILYRYRQLIPELAAEVRVPAVYPFREFVEAGGLIAYSPDLVELALRTAQVMHEIFGGAKPGDIPIYQPQKFELLINLKTAKALGLTVPQSILTRADEVIE
jgi:putative ABC transport system substrate-binding protein